MFDGSGKLKNEVNTNSGRRKGGCRDVDPRASAMPSPVEQRPPGQKRHRDVDPRASAMPSPVEQRPPGQKRHSDVDPRASAMPSRSKGFAQERRPAVGQLLSRPPSAIHGGTSCSTGTLDVSLSCQQCEGSACWAATKDNSSERTSDGRLSASYNSRTASSTGKRTKLTRRYITFLGSHGTIEDRWTLRALLWNIQRRTCWTSTPRLAARRIREKTGRSPNSRPRSQSAHTSRPCVLSITR